MGLEFREGLFDRVEVRAVGREEAQGRACRLDRFADVSSLVAGQIVHDDDVAGPEFGDEHLADIGSERIAVDRAVEHHRGDHAGIAQARDEGGGFPMAVGHTGAQAFASSAAAMAARHIGRRPGFVDEHEPVGVEVDLVLEPVPATAQDVGPVLLGGVRGLFLRVIL